MTDEQKKRKAERDRAYRARKKAEAEAARNSPETARQAPIDPAPEQSTNLDAKAQEEAYNAFFKNVADMSSFELMQRRRSKYS